MNCPNVSIIIPVFNSEDLLIKCLDSIKNQTMTNIEIICVDDGSSDNSLKILKDYEKNDSRFKVFHQENSGAGTARNNGLSYSKGEYILFVDSDDFIEKDSCEKLYNLAIRLNSDLILFDAVRHLKNGKNLNLIHFSKNNTTDFNNFSFNYEYTKDKVFDGYYGVIWNKFYKASFIKENNISFPKHKIYNDVEFHVKSLVLAKNIGYLPKILYHYNRIGQDSLQTSFVKTKNAFVFFDVLNGIRDFLNENNYFLEFKFDFINFSIFELRNKLDSIQDNFKEEFFEKSLQFFYSLNLTVEDFDNIPFEYFTHFLFVINSENYDDLNSFLNLQKI